MDPKSDLGDPRGGFSVTSAPPGSEKVQKTHLLGGMFDPKWNIKLDITYLLVTFLLHDLFQFFLRVLVVLFGTRVLLFWFRGGRQS